jgi:hypothetical protein
MISLPAQRHKARNRPKNGDILNCFEGQHRQPSTVSGLSPANRSETSHLSRLTFYEQKVASFVSRDRSDQQSAFSY